MEEEIKYGCLAPCDKESVITRGCFRLSILTERLFRIEYDTKGEFRDSQTQAVVSRKFPKLQYKIEEDDIQLTVSTSYLTLTYNKKSLCKDGLKIELKNGSVWHYGDKPQTLGGTVRTLDQINGDVKLGEGLMSLAGWSLYDDSKSMSLTDTGWIESPSLTETDLYFFGYGQDYHACLHDFYTLCGKQPLLPRYALGNWWSRYHKYTQEEYKELVNAFEKEKVPLAVSVIDMDWHITNPEEKYGSGWTGYTWNKKLFPNPPELLSWLHKKGLHTSLNLHPSDGVRAFEEPYTEMAKAMGVDPKTEEKIPFDAASRTYMDAYFKYLHHPLEKEGVDFWWIDWQQGTKTEIPGLDPLWVLNHFHTQDNKRDGKRSLILSRYAGIGSHRYPLGFSGDTYVTWEAFALQPYFTATASNIGYGWWSHDIGGHMCASQDSELTSRWVQFGTFSPIMRLHCTDCTFQSKEPWRYDIVTCSVMKKYLRLRHQLIPYLYTMMERAHTKGEPLIQPMYYDDPTRVEVYRAKNQYRFGTEMIVCPITEKSSPESGLGKVKAWIPEGVWFDFFNGCVYKGDQELDLFRSVENIPVLVKAGGIIPMTEISSLLNDTSTPDNLTIHVFAGDNNEFTLYEDDGRQNPLSAKTKLTMDWAKKTFTIHNPFGNKEILPTSRSIKAVFHGFDKAPDSVTINDKSINFKVEQLNDVYVATLKNVITDSKITVSFPNDTAVIKNRVKERAFKIFDSAQITFSVKQELYDLMPETADDGIQREILHRCQYRGLSSSIYGAIRELLFAEQSDSIKK